MRGIHVFSTRPQLAGRSAAGVFDDSTPKIPEATLLFMKLSALQWRRTNGTLKLYTDTAMKKFLDEHNLLSCWDDVDTDVLENFYRANNVRHDAFWSAGKFAAYFSEAAPFVCIDTDLAVWQPIDFSGDFMFAHWESIEDGDESYPEDLTTLSRPQGYCLTVEDSALFKTQACNMAITYFGNDDFKNEFTRRALDFMIGNDFNVNGRYATPEILYAEQRLPLALLLERKLSFRPVLDLTWSPLQFRITQFPPQFKNWFFSDLDTSKTFTHLWFHKKYLAENATENATYCAKVRSLIADAETSLQRQVFSENAGSISHPFILNSAVKFGHQL